MRSDTFSFQADDGQSLFVYRFVPDAGARPRAVIHIAHGMAEHAGRYARVAEALTDAGYAVYANDHRGHGKTAASPDELGFFTDSDGFRRVVRDLAALIAREKEEQPELPVVLFGHSMGSYLTQAYMIEHGHTIQGAVLSSSAGKPTLMAEAGRVIARLERLRLGPRGKSKIIKSLAFDQFNKAFAPNRTAFDWLSRDEAEVDKYIADPLCGFECTTQFWVDLLDALSNIARAEEQSRIPKDLPVYICSGTRDPSNENTKSLTQLIEAYRVAGLSDVVYRFYPEARHETLNEVNREEVTRDLIAWLDAHVARPIP